ncbi:MAG: hypothetical protein QM743_11205 [Chitinophagaceae bacterium]
MTGYEWYRRLTHRFRANNRHGTHSPFAYAFVEQVLNRKDVSSDPLIFPAGWIPDAQERAMVAKLVKAYACDPRIRIASEYEAGEGPMPLIVLLSPGEQFVRAAPGDIFIVPRIMRHESAFGYWRALVKDPSILLSIETNVMGLLFFRPEFLRKQHFRLKRG